MLREQQTAKYVGLIQELAKNTAESNIKFNFDVSALTPAAAYEAIEKATDNLIESLQNYTPEEKSRAVENFTVLKTMVAAVDGKFNLENEMGLACSIEVADRLLKAENNAVEFCCVDLPEYDALIHALDQEGVEENGYGT